MTNYTGIIGKRERLIRVWTGSKMIYLDSLEVEKENRGMIFYGEVDSHIATMDYTGLKDKNGVKIFEGDIIEVKSVRTSRSVVLWKDHIVRHDHEGEYSNLNGYTTFGKWEIESIDGRTTLAMKEGAFEVIGNIFEHSLLLTPSTND